MQPGRLNVPALQAANAIDPPFHHHAAPGCTSLRLGGDPLHLPLPAAVLPATAPQLAYHSDTAWAQRLPYSELDGEAHWSTILRRT